MFKQTKIVHYTCTRRLHTVQRSCESISVVDCKQRSCYATAVTSSKRHHLLISSHLHLFKSTTQISMEPRSWHVNNNFTLRAHLKLFTCALNVKLFSTCPLRAPQVSDNAVINFKQDNKIENLQIRRFVLATADVANLKVEHFYFTFVAHYLLCGTLWSIVAIVILSSNCCIAVITKM